MIKKTAYFCDICGKVFDDEKSCLSHEEKEKYRQFEERVAFFDRDGNFASNIKETFTIWVADKEAFNYVNQLLLEYGCIIIPSAFKETVPNVFYIDDNDDWRCLLNDVDRLLELEKKVKKNLYVRLGV